MITEAIILAGGQGTRLKNIVSDIPKPMVNISGKPFLEYIVRFLLNKGINKVIFSLGYKADVIEDYFKNEYCGLKLDYVIEKTPLGTGGGLALAMKKVSGNSVFVFNGDSLSLVSLESLSKFHRSVSADLTLVTKHVTDAKRYGVVQMSNQGVIKSFKEKKSEMGLINTGVYLISKKWFYEMKPNLQKFSFEKEMLEPSIIKGTVYGFQSSEYFIDIGIPEDYEKAKEEMIFLK